MGTLLVAAEADQRSREVGHPHELADQDRVHQADQEGGTLVQEEADQQGDTLVQEEAVVQQEGMGWAAGLQVVAQGEEVAAAPAQEGVEQGLPDSGRSHLVCK